MLELSAWMTLDLRDGKNLVLGLVGGLINWVRV